MQENNLITFAYDRERTVAYAHQWAYGRNPAYFDFSGIGGDCTNFTSQCIYAGAGVMNYTPTYGWYYRSINNRSPSWTGVPYLYNFLTGNTGPGPFGRTVPARMIEPGDIIQLRITGEVFHHSLVVVSTGLFPTPSNIRIATHTSDADNRLLSSYRYQDIRFIHIEAVRKYR